MSAGAGLTSKRLYFVLLGVAVLAFFGLFGGAYGVDKLLQAQSNKVREARLETLVLERQKQQLAKSNADIAEYEQLSGIARHIVPQDKDQTRTVREIVELAGRHNIFVGSIAFPTSSLGESPTDAQLEAVPNIPGVYTLEIVVESVSTAPPLYSDFVAFLDSLEHNRRTALVKTIALEPANADPERVVFTLTILEYIKP